MLDFLRSGLSKIISILFIFTVICFGICGVSLGKTLFDQGFVGFILGILIGIFISILTYGLVATIINIADNTEKMNYQLSKISNKLDKLSTDSTDSTNDSWVCKKCGETNYGNTICSKCGR